MDDLSYRRGPRWADVATGHAGTAVAAPVMSGRAMTGPMLRPQGRVRRVPGGAGVGLVAACPVDTTPPAPA